MGQGSSQLLTHTWIMNITQKPWYITEKEKREKGGLKKYNSEKERKNSKPLIILLGHN